MSNAMKTIRRTIGKALSGVHAGGTITIRG